MLKKLLTVGGWTLVSRVTGLVRDVALAAILGTGMVADAFVVALKLPNHFRAIFGEGAFNAAFVPAFSRIDETEGRAAALVFQGRILTILLIVQLLLLAVALVFMPQVIGLIAPGFSGDPAKTALAVDLARITFPYLALITLVTLYSGALNAGGRFAAAAAAPILLNIGIVLGLVGAGSFATAGHAAAWGVTLAGVAELLLLVVSARRAGLLAPPRRVAFDQDVKRFFKALGPATIGSMGTQIALFADTIIASLLPTGAVSSLYYADRLYQLPLGVIGIAAGTVLLPEMSRHLAAGATADAHRAQARAMLFTIALTAPFCAAFLIDSSLIMRAFFERGAFTAESAAAAAAALTAYAVGLPAVVLIRSAVASFYARGDTATPLWASLTGIAVNVGAKVLLMGPLQQAGLALATSIGAWTTFLILVGLASRQGKMRLDRPALIAFGAVLVGGAVMAVTMAAVTPLAADLAAGLPAFRALAELAFAGAAGFILYVVIAAIGFRVAGFRLRRPRQPGPAPLGGPDR